MENRKKIKELLDLTKRYIENGNLSMAAEILNEAGRLDKIERQNAAFLDRRETEIRRIRVSGYSEFRCQWFAYEEEWEANFSMS